MLTASAGKGFRPKLVLFLEDGVVVDASLSPRTRKYLEDLIAHEKGGLLGPKARPEQPEAAQDLANHAARRAGVHAVEDYLDFDAEFFDLLSAEEARFFSLRGEERKLLNDEIVKLSKDITNVTKPSRFRKRDLYAWRQMLDLYVQAEVFFSTRECDHGTRRSDDALKQLTWFQTKVIELGLTDSFKMPASRKPPMPTLLDMTCKLLTPTLTR